jgi:antitoxin (DNA-binding transcriptional repressor) of toxin-antitoxin stability system
MNATVVDLRTKMKQVLRALDRREKVTLLCRGKIRGTIIPVENETRVRGTGLSDVRNVSKRPETRSSSHGGASGRAIP